ncbi:hypothetical protein E2C01_011763 [Portunus trituberculatus]|uniref:Uncharacterized protein n=1 Tax=Portunus trituberculatus TaxID=210409 RepID=A0A5B7DCC3_PORTR|nr:hypothetical protein [Portunus trituberculatus]
MWSITRPRERSGCVKSQPDSLPCGPDGRPSWSHRCGKIMSVRLRLRCGASQRRFEVISIRNLTEKLNGSFPFLISLREVTQGEFSECQPSVEA